MAAVYGIDLSSNSSFAYGTDYMAYFDSALFEVGNDKNKWKPSMAELRLGRPLRTGEGVRISYRLSVDDSFTTVKTITYSDFGGLKTKTFAIQMPDNIMEAEQLQIRVALLGNSSTSPEFSYLKLS